MFNEVMKYMEPKEKKMIESLGVTNLDSMLDFLEKTGVNIQKLQEDVMSGKECNIDSYIMNPAMKSPGMPPHFHFTDEEVDEEDWDEDDMFFDEDEDDWDPYKLPSGLILDEPAREFHIRVKLNNSPVKVWRELKVPSNISLDLLAHILIEAMGWQNEHMHQFKTKDRIQYKDTAGMREAKKYECFGFQREHRDANDYSLNSVMEKGVRIKFEYDFGDGWEHDVWVKGIREYKPDEEPEAKLVKGEGACPPEDCGGVWGYARLLDLMTKKRKTAEEKVQLEWYGMNKHFDPEYFDVEEMTYYIEDFWQEVLQEIEDRKE